MILCPFYIFPSGMPQPADIVIAIGGIVFLISGKYSAFKNLVIVKYFRRFLFLVIIINVSYSFYYYAIEGTPNRMLFSSFFYLYNYLFFIMILYGLQSEKRKIVIMISILMSFALQIVLYLLGIGMNRWEEGMRSVLFFNNPNQLGYYGLSMLTLFIILSNSWQNKMSVPLQLLAFLFGSYLILSSLSFAAIGGALFLIGYYLYMQLKGSWVRGIIVFVIIFIVSSYALETHYIYHKLENLEERNDRKETASATQAQIRGYDRFYLHPEYIFYGAGEGKNNRFDSYHSLEMHSGLGTVLFSYGLFGFFLFMCILYASIRENILYSLSMLIPVLMYNVTHQGLRESLFWAILAALFMLSSSKYIDTPKI